MKLRNCIKKIVFLSLLSLIINNSQFSYMYAATPVESTQTAEPALSDSEIAQMRQVQQEILEPRLEKTRQLYDKLDFILEHLGQIVNNNQLKHVNKPEIIQHLAEFRMIIKQIGQAAYFQTDPMTLVVINSIAEHLTTYWRSIIKNGLTHFPEFDLDQVITRTIKEPTIDLEILDKKINQNMVAITALEKESQSVGISLFNKVYRNIEKLNHNYPVTSTVLKIGAAGLVLYAIIGASNKLFEHISEKYNNPATHALAKISEVVGERPSIGPNGHIQMPENPSYLARLEYIGLSLGLADLRMTPIITLPVIFRYLSPDWERFKIWSGNKWESFRSRLRGGPIMKKESLLTEPKARFSDIIGKENHKAVLSRLIEFIKNPELFIRTGTKPSTGILFTGPTRTGKSYLAEAFAGEIKDVLLAQGIDELSFIALDASRLAYFKEAYGITLDFIIREQQAKKKPCIIFIDEIDMLNLNKTGDVSALSALLNVMSGYMSDPNSLVILLGATNNPESLYHALLQPGRFDRTLDFDYPTMEERALYLMRELQNRGIITVDPEYLEKLAKETERCSFEDLNKIIVTALLNAKNDGHSLTAQDLEDSFDEQARKIIFDNLTINEQEKNLLAVHQAGHALATFFLDPSNEITKVTIRPVQTQIKEQPFWTHYDEKEKRKPVEYGKIFVARRSDVETSETYESLLAQCKISLAGHLAEGIIRGSTGYTYHNHDRKNAFDIAKYLVFKGMKEEDLSKNTRVLLLQKAEQLVEQCEQSVRDLLTHHKDALATLAQVLQHHLTVTLDDVKQIVQHHTAKTVQN